jgi:hypothetical protein
MLIRLLGKCYSDRLIVYHGTELSKMLQDAKLQPNAMQSIYQDPSIAAIISVLVHNIVQSPREHHLSLSNPTGHQTLLDTLNLATSAPSMACPNAADTTSEDIAKSSSATCPVPTAQQISAVNSTKFQGSNWVQGLYIQSSDVKEATNVALVQSGLNCVWTEPW